MGSQVVVHLVTFGEWLHHPGTIFPIAAITCLSTSDVLLRDMLVEQNHGIKLLVAVAPLTDQLLGRLQVVIHASRGSLAQLGWLSCLSVLIVLVLVQLIHIFLVIRIVVIFGLVGEDGVKVGGRLDRIGRERGRCKLPISGFIS